MRKYLICILLALTCSAAATVYVPATVPDPKREGQEYFVVDPDGIIGEEDVESLNYLCSSLDNLCRVELAIVCLDSIDSRYEIFQFGYELFQRWGIGKEGMNNGVLITLARSSHKVFINTGSGMEMYLTDAICHDIIQEDMIPRFREDDYAGGVLMGAMRIYELCSEDGVTEELLAMRSVTNRGGFETGRTMYSVSSSKDDDDEGDFFSWSYWLMCLFYTLVFAALYALLMLPVLIQRKGRSVKAENTQRGCWSVVIVLLIVGIAIWLDFYEYWPALLAVFPMYRIFKGYVRCEACGKFGHHSIRRRTTIEPTYTKKGEEEIIFTCSQCGHQHKWKEEVPKLSPPSEKSHRSRGGGYNSSSGGSWGGGSTSGGGAGGSW